MSRAVSTTGRYAADPEACVRCGRPAEYDSPGRWCAFHWRLWWTRGSTPKWRNLRQRRHWLNEAAHDARRLDRMTDEERAAWLREEATP